MISDNLLKTLSPKLNRHLVFYRVTYGVPGAAYVYCGVLQTPRTQAGEIQLIDFCETLEGYCTRFSTLADSLHVVYTHRYIHGPHREGFP